MTGRAVVLVHSPIVGPMTWVPVGQRLADAGLRVLLPDLPQAAGDDEPSLIADATAVARVIEGAELESPPVLVAHSGAGPLLPAIGAFAGAPAAYVFVDASVPVAGASRLDLLAVEQPRAAVALLKTLDQWARFPTWTDADLVEVLSDPGLRSELLAAVRPRGLRYLAEPIPVPQGWPDAPCGYVLLSSAYRAGATCATRRGWAVRTPLPGAGHFALLAEPHMVADALMEVLAAMGVRTGAG